MNQAVQTQDMLDPVADWYASLTPASLEMISQLYTEAAYFKDPFNEVRGHDAIKHIMTHMFTALEQPRFQVGDRIQQGQQGFLTWTFLFSWRGKPMEIAGSSHFRFAADGRVSFHRDYWDAAEELYEKLPVLGWLLKRLKKAMASS